MKIKPIILLLLLVASLSFTSCTSYHKTIREPNTRMELTMADFDLSEQVSAEASTTTVFSIDFQRLFISKAATIDNQHGISFANIPVLGNSLFDPTANYALYKLLDANPGYDVVIYPQYEIKTIRPILGLGILTKVTTVKVTARLGKLRN